MADTVLGGAFLLVFASLAAAGVVCIVAPGAIRRVRSRFGATDAAWFGGWFYATPLRTRCTGALLLAVALLGLAHLRA
jgi:hypothetical protein